MTRFITILVLLVIGLKSNAQQYFLDGNNIDFELRLPGTNPAMGSSYCDGKPCEGLLIKLDSNDRLISKSYYRNGKRNGSYETYYPTEVTKATGRMKENYNTGIRIEYYETGMIKSIEYFPEDQLGIIDGTEKITYYENGNVETYYAYTSEWIPTFHYDFSETGDTLIKIEPLEQDSTIFEITEYEDNQKISEKKFRLNKEGQREFIIKKK